DLEEAFIYGAFMPKRLIALLETTGASDYDRMADLTAMAFAVVGPRERVAFAPTWVRRPLEGTRYALAIPPAPQRWARVLGRVHGVKDVKVDRWRTGLPGFDPATEAAVEGLDASIVPDDAVVEGVRVVERDPDRIELELVPPAARPRAVVISELFIDDAWRA